MLEGWWTDITIELNSFTGRTYIATAKFRVNACLGPAMDYISTDSGVDNSSRFPFRTRTDILKAQPTRRLNGYIAVVGNGEERT